MDTTEEAAVTVESLRFASVPKVKPPDGRAPEPNAGTEGVDVDVVEPKGLGANAEVGVGVGAAAAGGEGADENEGALGLAKLNGEGAEEAVPPKPKDGAGAVGAVDAAAPFVFAAGALGAEAKGLAPAGALNEGKVGVEILGVLVSAGFGVVAPNIGVADVGVDAASGNSGLGTDGGLDGVEVDADDAAGKAKVVVGFGAEGAAPTPEKRLLGTEAGLPVSSFL